MFSDVDYNRFLSFLLDLPLTGHLKVSEFTIFSLPCNWRGQIEESPKKVSLNFLHRPSSVQLLEYET